MHTILICDDHPMVRDALVGTIGAMFPEARIVEAGTFPDAWSAAGPDIGLCLCDLVMPGSEPIAGIAALRRIMPATPLLIITGSSDDRSMLALLDLGVSGFLPKTANAKTIRAVVQLILTGERHLPPRLHEIMNDQAATAPAKPLLPAQQVKVLVLASRGLTNKEIARELSIAPSSVKTHLGAAFRSLQVGNRHEAVEKARAAGLLR